VAGRGVEVETVGGGHSPRRHATKAATVQSSPANGRWCYRTPRLAPRRTHFNDIVGKRVRVTGDLETYKQKSVIKVTRPTQVKVMKTPKMTEKK